MHPPNRVLLLFTNTRQKSNLTNHKLPSSTTQYPKLSSYSIKEVHETNSNQQIKTKGISRRKSIGGRVFYPGATFSRSSKRERKESTAIRMNHQNHYVVDCSTTRRVSVVSELQLLQKGRGNLGLNYRDPGRVHPTILISRSAPRLS